MTERIRSIAFARNDDTFLWFCLTCRETGIPASRRLKIADEVQALDIDNAVTLRLLRFDTKVKEADAKRLAYEVRKMVFGDGSESGDQYGESQAEVW